MENIFKCQPQLHGQELYRLFTKKDITDRNAFLGKRNLSPNKRQNPAIRLLKRMQQILGKFLVSVQKAQVTIQSLVISINPKAKPGRKADIY
jgi:hypothetical protein